jgi:putative transposase
MPRLARLDAPGVVHHIIIRGIERRSIFRDDKDRDNLLDRLSDLLPATSTACYAWAFLPNHAHFLFRTGTTSISHLMLRLLTGYVVSFNKRYRRHGPLFQNRFKSIICQEDRYLLELVRYIHLNPLRAGIVHHLSALMHYKYCGNSALMGKRQLEWQDTAYVLSCFGKEVSEARRSYSAYVKDGIGHGRRPELVGGGLIRSLGGWKAVKSMGKGERQRIKGDERILGDSDFVLQVLQETDERLNRSYELNRRGYDLKMVEDRVCRIFGIAPEELYAMSREKLKASARGLFCYWAVRELGYGATEVARQLDITQPAVGYAVKRGERIAKLHSYKLLE